MGILWNLATVRWFAKFVLAPIYVSDDGFEPDSSPFVSAPLPFQSQPATLCNAMCLDHLQFDWVNQTPHLSADTSEQYRGVFASN